MSESGAPGGSDGLQGLNCATGDHGLHVGNGRDTQRKYCVKVAARGWHRSVECKAAASTEVGHSVRAQPPPLADYAILA